MHGQQNLKKKLTGRCLSAEKSQQLYVRSETMNVLFKLPYVTDFVQYSMFCRHC